MKRYLLFLFALMVVTAVPVNSAYTVEESTDAEYLINAGYSQMMAEDIFMQKNRTLSKPIEPLYETSNNILVKGWRKLFSYIDSAQDEYDRLHHDIKPSPSFSDL